MSQIIIGITGPGGAGKSTVSGKIAKLRKKCANIEADQVKHFLVSAFNYETKPDGTKTWTFEDWELLGESLGILAKKFAESGYDVIINGHIDHSAWKSVQEQVTLTHKFLLLPDVEMTKSRDKQRSNDAILGDEAVINAHQYFVSTAYYNDFLKIDTTNQDVDKTVLLIQNEINS